MTSFDLVEPRSLEEAFRYLDPSDPAIRPFGGGTALMLMIKAQMYKPQRLVSLGRLGGRFSGISFDANACRIGAMTRFATLEHSPEIAARLPVITEAMKTLANVRVRNVATVGGNLGHADPHLDLPPIWLVLDAKVTVVNRGGERVLPVADIFSGYYETTLGNDELIAEVEVPVRQGWRSKYVKVTTRATHDWPALGLAISVQIDGHLIKDLRIVLSAAVDFPRRLLGAEAVLRGAAIDEPLLQRAGEAAAEEADMESDSRGTGDYKRHLLRAHLRRAVLALAAE
ncbi:MAG: FAD binding domain-containing protein [Pseudolabrys sp.]|nr:FAD binding domain-containing protein [Pseudolabrys sp.]MDP2295438.1 FAD binding domain-containing protein [Pseudolabrys sp.]